MLTSKFINTFSASLKITAKSPLPVTAAVQNVAATAPSVSAQPCRSFNIAHINRPKPGPHRHLRFQVQYPKDGKYTVDHLPTTRLGGRDPDTGRIIHGAWGGGRKTKYRWVDFDRRGPKEADQYRHERVLSIEYDPNRTANIALVCGGTEIRYIIATTNMQEKDIIRSTSYIPETPIRGKEGDAYPVGALAVGTKICQLAEDPEGPSSLMVSALKQGVVAKRLPGNKTLVTLPHKAQVAVDSNCMCVVGQVSDGRDIPIGSAQRLRWLGHRPRSGLWQRKDGYCGRKIRPLPPIKDFTEQVKREKKYVKLRCLTEEPFNEVPQATDRVS